MQYSDDAFTTMLLTLSLSPDREEYARPLSTSEFRALAAAVHSGPARNLGRLLGMDISGLMQLLAIPEEDALRIFTLLGRTVQLTYALEGFLRLGIEAVTQFDGRYPLRLQRRLGEAAPPVFYAAGDLELLSRPLIAIAGISGIKTAPVARSSVERIVSEAERLGYGIVTGGELGVSHLALELVAQGHGTLVDLLGGGLSEHVRKEPFARLLREGRAAAVSLEHPEALFTASHAIARNKAAFSLAEAVFIMNTDGRRGESDALRQRLSDNIYAWDGYPGNAALISRGATPFGSAAALDFGDLSRRWKASRAEQISFFDLMGSPKED